MRVAIQAPISLLEDYCTITSYQVKGKEGGLGDGSF